MSGGRGLGFCGGLLWNSSPPVTSTTSFRAYRRRDLAVRHPCATNPSYPPCPTTSFSTAIVTSQLGIERCSQVGKSVELRRESARDYVRQNGIWHREPVCTGCVVEVVLR